MWGLSWKWPWPWEVKETLRDHIREKRSKWPKNRTLCKGSSEAVLGSPRVSVTLAQGSLTATSNCPLMKKWESLSSRFLQKRKPFRGLWISSDLALSARTQCPLSTRPSVLSFAKCPPGNDTSWAALILACPLKGANFLISLLRSNPENGEGGYENEPKQQRRKREERKT